MATTQKIHIVTEDTGLWKVKQTAESAEKASELLQQDLEACPLPRSRQPHWIGFS